MTSHQAEIEDTRRLFAWIQEQDKQLLDDLPHEIGIRIFDAFLSHVPPGISGHFGTAVAAVLGEERYLWPTPPPAFDRMSLKELTEYRHLLFQKRHFIKNEEAYYRLLFDGVGRAFGAIANDLPSIEQPSPFTIPLIYTVPDPRRLVSEITATMTATRFYDRGMFKDLADRLLANARKVSGSTPTNRRPLKPATESDLPLDELVSGYLGGTPFHDLLMAPVPLKLSQKDRFSHMHVVGGTGAGKTSLLEHLILSDLRSPDPPSLVIVDPHGDLINRLTHADLGIEDRLIVIDPRDTKHPPALNVFAINQERMRGYDEATREQVTAGVIQTFDYLFTGLVGADLTAKQGVFFRYVARLMLALPDALGRNATILDMIQLMRDPTPYAKAIEQLPPLQREFFAHDFATKTFAQTKEQIAYRLRAIIENPTLARLFTAPETKVDLFTELNRGSVILVDTAKDFLKDGSGNFGRIFISLTLQAVLERAAIPEARRKPTFLIVDEAATYFDSNIDDLLTDARKYRCGVVLSHQYLDQATGSLRASLHANTGIKFASGLSASDARSMAPEMRTTADFILNQPGLQFAAHIKNVTPQAVSIPIRPGALARVPTLSPAAYERLVERNRTKVSLPSVPVSPATPDEDISREW